ncbi:MAG: sulfurtransferase [Anaerolineales bacterium]|nr:sulfurtransferase [Anaerolineales bacterium]
MFDHSSPPSDLNLYQSQIYEFRLHGQIGEEWNRWFNSATIIQNADGETVLLCPVADQAALHGLLKKVRDLGIVLRSVMLVETPPIVEKYNTSHNPKEKYPMNREKILIEADELLKKFEDKNLLIFDASVMNNMYLEAHIPGAVYFDHTRFSDLNSPYELTLSQEADLELQIGQAGISNTSEVVVYASGMLPYAVRAWWVLRYAGHEYVRILNGGLAAWQKVGGPLEKEVHQYAPTSFQASFRSWMFASKEEVLAAIGNEDVGTINTMPLISHNNRHIVGSTCLPALDLMKDMDNFSTDEQIIQRLKEITQHKRIITYCGGGIAATINAAALLIAGYENVAVYDGSLYEWLGEGLPANGAGDWKIWTR